MEEECEEAEYRRRKVEKADRQVLKWKKMKLKAMEEAVASRLQEAQLGPIGEEWPPAVVQEPAEVIEGAGKGQARAGCHCATQVQEETGGKAWPAWV